MITRRRYAENLALLTLALRNPNLNGLSIVECGTWKGGMAAGMIHVGGSARDYYFFDSFEGLPPAKEIDGKSAISWQANTESPGYHDNCSASLEDFWETVGRTGVSRSKIHATKGFFEDTLPSFEPPELSVLRLDGDWYDSTIICLEKFWDYLVPGGIALIDDYGTWEGCTKAVHDFLSSRKAAEPISQGPIGRVSYLVKR